jgi:hypothetical protein
MFNNDFFFKKLFDIILIMNLLGRLEASFIFFGMVGRYFLEFWVISKNN